jgi:predicted membrane protein
MKKSTSILWGIALIVGGGIFALNALGITSINIFFTGWWTLFIIIPCAVGLFTEKKKFGNLVGIAFGVFLLLCARDILEFDMIWKLFLPVVAVCAGLKLVFSGIFGKKKPAPVEVEIHIGSGGANTAVFSGSEINYSGQSFTGTELTAIFGGIDCDLRGAIIEKDCRIQITSVFGGIDLYMPENVNVSTNVTGIFGGADSKVSHKHDGPTVYIEGVCIFGGVDIQ